MAILFTEDGSTITGESWLWSLQYMASVNKPVFVGRLQNDWWKEDEFLSEGIERGWIKIIPTEGFLITDLGKTILKERNLSTTRHSLDGFK